jgi:hypothetical protein
MRPQLSRTRQLGAAVLLALACCAAACGSKRIEAAPGDHVPSVELAPIARGALCVTRGALDGVSIVEPTMRGYASGAGGDAAQLTFTYHGESAETRTLAGGQARRQIGLKLRAQDGCNVIYAMWRLDPRPTLDISLKHNPGASTHEQCGADGYTKVRAYKKLAVPALRPGATHTVRAEIVGSELFAWIDGRLLWQGRLPDAARSLRGPAGVRSDNVRFDLIELAAARADSPSAAAPCKREGSD